MTDPKTETAGESRPLLSLTDAVSIIVGIVIGSTIYKMPPFICGIVADPVWTLALWGIGGILAFIGALCYAELTSTYPHAGGDYYYLSRAFGPWAGFLFGWGQLTAILTASIGAMAFVFAEYGLKLHTFGEGTETVFALAAVAALTAMNIAGIVFGKLTQNILTGLKVVGLAGILISGFAFGKEPTPFVATSAPMGPPIGLAMIFILYAYGGWNDAAFVAAEVRNPQRNTPIALLAGVAGITIIYVAVNAAYMNGLGYEGVRNSQAVAADVLSLSLGDFGAKAMSILVMVSALGAVNGLILTGSRVYETLGRDYSLFAVLGRRNEQSGSPVAALLIQLAIVATMILAFGTQTGRDLVNRGLSACGFSPLPFQKDFGSFETLVAATAPAFWGFFLLTGLALFALRERDPDIHRPFQVPLYPLLPLIFIGTCFYMLFKAIDYSGSLALLGAAPLAVGVPLYWLSPRRAIPEEPPPPAYPVKADAPPEG
jgi:amino acid transporter